MARTSYVVDMACVRCGAVYPHDRPRNGCDCGAPTLYRYDLSAAKADLRPADLPAEWGVWHFGPLLPVTKPGCRVTLGEGGTPLLPLPRAGKAIGLSNLWLKDEGLNPTGTFKARGAAVGISKIKEWGLTDLVLASTGSGGLGWATYAQRGGCNMHLFMGAVTVPTNLRGCVQMGADVSVVQGDHRESERLARESERAFGWYNCAREMCRIEGKKTIALELAEQLGWRAPDVVFCPTAGAVAAVAFWKAFKELSELGWVTSPPPRIVAVQSVGCAPIARALDLGVDEVKPWEHVDSIAPGLLNPAPFLGPLALRALRETGGTAIPVTDDEIRSAMGILAGEEGLSVCPEGAATYVAAAWLARDGWLKPGEEVVLINTGSGLKYPELLPEVEGLRQYQVGESLARA